MEKKRILLVSPFFAPENSVASIRFTKLGKYLAQRGYVVDVLCGNMNARFIEDETLKEDMKWFDKVIRIEYPELYYLPIRKTQKTGSAVQKAGDRKANTLKSRIIKLFYNECTSSIWVYLWDKVLASKYIQCIKKQKWEYFDVVITTYSPMLSHYVGNYLKRRKMCGTWIADYRDPFLTFHEKKGIPQFVFKDNLRIERKADIITTVSEGTKEQIVMEAGKYQEEIKKKIHVIYNGYDVDDRDRIKQDIERSDKLQIAYCGMFYKQGNEWMNSPEILFKALGELIKEKRMEDARIKFIYAGPSFEIVRELAEKYDILSIVENHGYVSRSESLRLQQSADIILLCSWNTKLRKGVMTGKFYEALLLENTVLALVKGELGGSELKKVIKECNIGFCYEDAEEEDYSQIKKWLLEKYQEKERVGYLEYKCSEQVNGFRHDMLAADLEKLWTVT